MHSATTNRDIQGPFHTHQSRRVCGRQLDCQIPIYSPPMFLRGVLQNLPIKANETQPIASVEKEIPNQSTINN